MRITQRKIFGDLLSHYFGDLSESFIDTYLETSTNISGHYHKDLSKTLRRYFLEEICRNMFGDFCEDHQKHPCDRCRDSSRELCRAPN